MASGVTAELRAAGILFFTGDRVLLLKRSADAKDAPGTWGLPGGHIEGDENPAAAAIRETREETGYNVGSRAGKRLWASDDGFVCFGQAVAKPFAVKLNSEHTEARWAPFNDLPKPLHPGLAKELSAMPLIQGKSDKARSENIATEIEAGKDPKQAAAIGYSVQRKAQANDEQQRASNGQFGSGTGSSSNNPHNLPDDVRARLAKLAPKIKAQQQMGREHEKRSLSNLGPDMPGYKIPPRPQAKDTVITPPRA